MWIGSVIHETPQDEKDRAELFFADLQKPYELDVSLKLAASPYEIIGSTLAMFGCALSAISLLILTLYHDFRAFSLNLTVGAFFVLFGLVLTVLSIKRVHTVKTNN
jgi:hypothetical protein